MARAWGEGLERERIEWHYNAKVEAARFLVSGQVQGVGYRFFVLRAARDLNLRGWVRNRSDATVEVAAAGSASSLRLLERRLNVGPPAARVEEVVRTVWPSEMESWDALTDFEIRREEGRNGTKGT